jgi:hypothetical protein
MSNHYHAVIYDRAGRYPEFIEHFHKLLAHSQNALRGRWENLWSAEQTCVVKLADREAVIDKLVYTAANPVQDHLVDRVDHWPGVNGLGALLAGRPLRATRPLHFFRPDGAMPDALELPLTVPAELGPAAAVLSELCDRVRAVELGPAAAVLSELCDRVRAVELERAAERGRTGRRVLGRRAVLAQSWRDSPATCERWRNLRPRVASRSKWARIEALLRNRAFAMEYASAASDGETAFPPCSHLAPTGSSGSRRCQCSRHDLVRVVEDRAENRRTRCADTAWYLGCLVAPSHRPIDQRGARRPRSRAIRPPSACKMTHRSNVGIVDVPRPRGPVYSFLRRNLVRVFPRTGLPLVPRFVAEPERTADSVVLQSG